MRLIYFSPVPRASFRQRPHEFTDWFQLRLGGPVLWIDPYPVRLPRLGDLHRPRVAAAAQDASPPGLEVLRPAALPLEPLAAGRWLHRTLFWPGVLRRLREFASHGDTLLAIGKPSELALQSLVALPGVASLYDAMDDFAAFHAGLSRAAAQRIEAAIVERATHRITSSSRIRELWRSRGIAATLVPNGVASARLPPASQAPSDAPLGYVGTVAAWFDWPWIEELAVAQPHRRIEIVGPLFRPPPRALPGNVLLGAALPHAQALERMRAFAAGLIPFLRTPLTDSVDPVKYYEYRALGLPVISTAFGEMRHRAHEPGVLLTDAPAAAGEDIRALLARRDTAESVAQFRRTHDWETRFAPLADLLQAPR